jgi:hypothetical protein
MKMGDSSDGVERKKARTVEQGGRAGCFPSVERMWDLHNR